MAINKARHLILFVFSFSLWSCYWESGFDQQELSVAVEILDVGQGDAILLSRGGNFWMIDAGEAGSGIRSKLQTRGVEKIERLFLSHHHLDHIGGVPEILRTIPVARLSVSCDREENATWSLIQRLADSLEIPIDTLWRGEWIALGGEEGKVSLKVLWPHHALWQSGNNASLVLQLITPTARALMMGDLEGDMELELLELEGNRLASELLKVGHHGSRTSSVLPFIGMVRPLHVAISVGSGNSYGHPHAETLADLKCVVGEEERIHRTDDSGDLLFHFDGSGLIAPNFSKREGLLRW